MNVPPTTTLYFVRHGESEANTLRIISNRASGFGLTALGRQQALTLAHTLNTVPVSAIFSSPLLRTQQTADILSRHLGRAYSATDALREYDCGVLEGQADKASWQLHQETFEAWLFDQDRERKPDGGEGYLDIQTRFVPFVGHLTSSERGGHVVLVGHGRLFQLMLPHVLANVDAAFVRAHGIDHTDCIIAEREVDELVCLHWGPLTGYKV